MFDEFWKLYPRKINKKAAQKAFVRLSEDEKKLAVDKIGAHVRFWESKDTELQFIPHASSWLNGARWEDELEFTVKNNWKLRFIAGGKHD